MLPGPQPAMRSHIPCRLAVRTWRNQETMEIAQLEEYQLRPGRIRGSGQGVGSAEGLLILITGSMARTHARSAGCTFTNGASVAARSTTLRNRRALAVWRQALPTVDTQLGPPLLPTGTRRPSQPLEMVLLLQMMRSRKIAHDASRVHNPSGTFAGRVASASQGDRGSGATTHAQTAESTHT